MLLPALAALLVAGTPVIAKTWYVDSAATGSGNGAAQADAWRRMADIAWASLAPGDVVEVRGGPFDERVAIGRSGTSPTARITLQGIGRPVIRGINGGSHDYVAVIGFEITHTSSVHNYEAIRLAGSDGWLIQDNLIQRTYSGGVSGAYGTVNTRNIVRANTFDDVTGASGGLTGAPVISLFGDFNLVEYNAITKSLDRTRAFGTGNVIRNNYFGPTDPSHYPNSSPFPHHTDSFQSYESTRPLRQFLYERNWDQDNLDSVAGTNAHGVLIQAGSSSEFGWAILRFNVLLRTGGTAYQFQNVDGIYGYNLTSVAMQSGASGIWRSAVTYDSPGGGHLHQWRNNTWAFAPNTASGIFTSTYAPTGFSADFQHRFDAGALPAGVNNVPDSDPLFVARSGGDYRLQSGSPLRARGGPLTTATSSGSNATSLSVADAGGLFDGWGIAEGDIIRIGAGEFVRIASIDYAANVVTLAAARTWAAGDPIRVKGMDDIGALPHAYAQPVTVSNTTSAALPSGSVTLTATVGNPDAVRMVEFLVDGRPVGLDHDAPYAVAWTSDGGAHSIEARAYSLWAGTTLYASSTVNSDGAAPAPATAPSFTRHPADATIATGDSVTFEVTVAGDPPPALQWRRDGVDIPGANAATYSLANASSEDAGSYDVVATNSAGQAVSNAAILAVNSAPVITTQPNSQSVPEGSTVTFSVEAAGDPAPAYQWFKDGAAILGATGSSHTIASVTAADAGSYLVEVSNPAGSATGAAATLAVLATEPVSPSLRFDFDGDGRTDILASNTVSGELEAWLLDGTDVGSVVELGNVGPQWELITTGNFNGDAAVDIVWRNRSTDEHTVWLMAGAEAGRIVTLGTYAPEWRLSGTADFNQDGNSDLLWHNQVNGEVRIWLMNGTDRGDTHSLPTRRLPWRLAGAGDIDGDGNPDVLWQNTSTGRSEVQLMSGVQARGTVALNKVSKNWLIVGTGDLNQDGQTDIIWQNSVNGECRYWLMEGATVRVNAVLAKLPAVWTVGN